MHKKIELMKWADAQKEIAKGHVYLEFVTAWCGDCKMMEPIVDEVAEEFADDNRIRIIRVDAEEANLFRDANNKYQVLKVPTHLILKDGEIFRKGFEYYPKQILVEWIKDSLK
ncbi:thioredoxin family protein [Mycoplasma iguanae]|uniref:Thioredoxin family protein n=1 Tax=Mycoplasma iguanae TaxID=292461 RepID=A0ABY5R961_9MOLU|nr:thioredoxin family protein [Mycoplasma iguanae]UVD81973.1 thioredoxin family protein [Mycoplasma iguanae]